MQKTHWIGAAIVVAAVCSRTSGQRVLDRIETNAIIKSLTDRPQTTWITAGVIQARHLEYRAAAEQIMESGVTVRYDGDRFYWEINIDSDNGETMPAAGLSPDAVDVKWNKRRVFVWDGRKYTLYFRPGNHAIVYEDSGRVPVAVNGPLTAGLIPWGYGVYTSDALAGAEVSAIETRANGVTAVELTVRPKAGLQMTFVLDRSKNYAVLSSTVRSEGRSVVVGTCDGYRLIGGRWVPATVEVERYDDSRTPAQLLSYDHWDLASVSTQVPAASSFAPGIEREAMVEEYTRLSDKPLAYYRGDPALTDLLRQMRLEIVAAGRDRSPNCAAVTTRYVLSRAGRQMTQQQMASMTAADAMGVSLHAIKGVLTGAGLQCRAVRTDLETLRTLKNCHVILHLPARKHFLILDHVDDRRVWLIDLDHNRFYFPMDINLFGLEWADGTALLVSSQSPTPVEGLNDIPEETLKNILGADSFGTYSCTQMIQDYHVDYCIPMPEGACGGQYREYERRYACELSPEGASCQSDAMLGYQYMYCLESPSNPGQCVVDGCWKSRYIHACQ